MIIACIVVKAVFQLEMRLESTDEKFVKYLVIHVNQHEPKKKTENLKPNIQNKGIFERI